MPRIIPNLWFDTEAHDAAEFYVSVFPNSRITGVSRYPDASPAPAGSVQTVDFELDGRPHTGINGGPHFSHTEAFSLLVECADQDQIDHYWNELVAGGGGHGRCGWLKDRFGVSWQVVPAGIAELVGGPDSAAASRAMQAMFGMGKLEIAALRAAAAGEGDRSTHE